MLELRNGEHVLGRCQSASALTRSTTFFVIGFSTFLFSCIDYSKLSRELAGPGAVGRLEDVLVPQCLAR
jgi:autophagy-related protein 9